MAISEMDVSKRRSICTFGGKKKEEIEKRMERNLWEGHRRMSDWPDGDTDATESRQCDEWPPLVFTPSGRSVGRMVFFFFFFSLSESIGPARVPGVRWDFFR